MEGQLVWKDEYNIGVDIDNVSFGGFQYLRSSLSGKMEA